jgi:hypothetical protein
MHVHGWGSLGQTFSIAILSIAASAGAGVVAPTSPIAVVFVAIKGYPMARNFYSGKRKKGVTAEYQSAVT